MAPLSSQCVVFEGCAVRRRDVTRVAKSLAAGSIRTLILDDVRLPSLLWDELARAVSRASTVLSEVRLINTALPSHAHRSLAKWGASPIKSFVSIAVSILPDTLCSSQGGAQCLGVEAALLSKTDPVHLPHGSSLADAWCFTSAALTACRNQALRHAAPKQFGRTGGAAPSPSILLGPKGFALFNESAALGLTPAGRVTYIRAWVGYLERVFGLDIGVGRAMKQDALQRVVSSVRSACTSEGLRDAVASTGAADGLRELRDTAAFEGILQRTCVRLVVSRVAEAILSGSGFDAEGEGKAEKAAEKGGGGGTLRFLRVMSALKLDSLYPHDGECALDAVAIAVESGCRAVARDLAEMSCRPAGGTPAWSAGSSRPTPFLSPPTPSSPAAGGGRGCRPACSPCSLPSGAVPVGPGGGECVSPRGHPAPGGGGGGGGGELALSPLLGYAEEGVGGVRGQRQQQQTRHPEAWGTPQQQHHPGEGGGGAWGSPIETPPGLPGGLRHRVHDMEVQFLELGSPGGGGEGWREPPLPEEVGVEEEGEYEAEEEEEEEEEGAPDPGSVGWGAHLGTPPKSPTADTGVQADFGRSGRRSKSERRAGYRGTHRHDIPPPASNILRFSIGSRVLCIVEEGLWQSGTVSALWERGYPYRIRLDSGGSRYAPKDSASFIVPILSDRRKKPKGSRGGGGE